MVTSNTAKDALIDVTCKSQLVGESEPRNIEPTTIIIKALFTSQYSDILLALFRNQK
jgi:hypothetical protein